MSGHAPFMWDTVDENFAGDDATVGDWLIEASTGPANLRVGHQQAATSTLAMDAFNRRGLSLAISPKSMEESPTPRPLAAQSAMVARRKSAASTRAHRPAQRPRSGYSCTGAARRHSP